LYNLTMPLTLLAIAVSLLVQSQTPALPFVAPVFSSDMVLQRDMADPIWGWTSPGAHVTVAIDGKKSNAVADSTGKWSATLPKFRAGGSYDLTVSGPSTAKFSNVTFGDVWICSGQSNMEFGIGNILNPQAEIAAANLPNIRLYVQPRLIALSPTQGVGDAWKVCTPENLASYGSWNGFSAVAYFFGKKLNQDLNVPIGLIHTSWGGTIAEAWTPAEWLHKNLPEFDPALKAVDAQRQRMSQTTQMSYSTQLAQWYQDNDPGSAGGFRWSAPGVDTSGWATIQVPGFFQKAGIPELVNQASVVWYRKEIDVSADAAGKDAELHFIADDNDRAFVNGTFVGASDGYNIERNYKIPGSAVHVGKNVVAIRVTDTSQPGGIYGPGDSVYLTTGNGVKTSLAGDWQIKLGVAIGASNPLPVATQDNPNIPTVLYNGMIAPIAPFGVKGAIWYQGESNVGRAKQYQRLLPTMIESWREAFHSGDFPFLIVQLAGFQKPAPQPGDDAWAELRDAQFIASKAVRNGGLATAVDVGEVADIHPKNKQEVGRRLALLAEAKFYHKGVAFSGPIYKSMSSKGAAIIISFDHAGGLKTSDGSAVRGFAIAGDDHKWYWADAKIDGNKVVVSASDVPHPVAVRYAWASYTDLNLQNGDGFPALPFKSDDWTTH
jgi:sialate O-acetylesterase